MNIPVRALFFIAAAALAAAVQAEGEGWAPSTLSPATLDKVHAGLEVYGKCANDETRAHIDDRDDSRRVADLILKNCEPKLTAIKAAFDAEKVPDSISERYLRSKRSLIAQQVLRVVMATQAVQSTQPPAH